jgi:hypothetical protein
VTRGRSSLFRGSELPRLLFLAAIVLAGWPVFLLFAHSRPDDRPPTPALAADRITPVVADDGVEFQALVDKMPIQLRESAAYATLLRRARETPAAELASKARRDIFFTHLWDRPRLYRGVPIHLEGTAKKVLTYEVAPSMSPGGRLYEAWVYSDENRATPYVVAFEDPPPGLAIGHELNLRVTFDGYFMKLMSYQAADHRRAAPMLVGRMRWPDAPAPTPSPLVEMTRLSRRNVVILVGVLLAGYIAFRVFFQVRKALAPGRRPTPLSSFGEGLAPEEVADWLQNLPDEGPEAEGEIPPLRESPGLRDR